MTSLCTTSLVAILKLFGFCSSISYFEWPTAEEVTAAMNAAQDEGLPAWTSVRRDNGYEFARVFEHDCDDGRKLIGRKIFISFDEVADIRAVSHEGLTSVSFVFDPTTASELRRLIPEVQKVHQEYRSSTELQPSLDAISNKLAASNVMSREEYSTCDYQNSPSASSNGSIRLLVTSDFAWRHFE